MDRLYQLLVTMEMTPLNGCGLYVDGCVSALIGRLSEDKLALIRQVKLMTAIPPSPIDLTLPVMITVALPPP